MHCEPSLRHRAFLRFAEKGLNLLQIALNPLREVQHSGRVALQNACRDWHRLWTIGCDNGLLRCAPAQAQHAESRYWRGFQPVQPCAFRSHPTPQKVPQFACAHLHDSPFPSPLTPERATPSAHQYRPDTAPPQSGSLQKKSGCRYSNRYCFVPTDHRKQLLTIQTIIH